MQSINLRFGLAIVAAIALSGMYSCDRGTQIAKNSSADMDSTATGNGNSSVGVRNVSNNTTANSTGNMGDTNGGNGNATNSSRSGTQHNWSLVITPNTTQSYLDSVTAKWKRENIDLSISKFKCDANGNLVKIKGSVVINTPAGNHASGEFKSENLASIQIKVDDSPNVSIKGN
jgi:hypothetical protein